jgi:hypothetical protein
LTVHNWGIKTRGDCGTQRKNSSPDFSQEKRYQKL